MFTAVIDLVESELMCTGPWCGFMDPWCCGHPNEHRLLYSTSTPREEKTAFPKASSCSVGEVRLEPWHSSSWPKILPSFSGPKKLHPVPSKALGTAPVGFSGARLKSGVNALNGWGVSFHRNAGSDSNSGAMLRLHNFCIVFQGATEIYRYKCMLCLCLKLAFSFFLLPL